jgi:ankyrin repeat protein
MWALTLHAAATFGASPDAPLLRAAKSQHPERVAALLKQHTDPNISSGDGTTALHWATHWNDLAMADSLIQAGANVNAATQLGATPLYLACINGSGPMVNKLLGAGANARAALVTGESVLMTCSRAGNVEAVKELLRHGADVNGKESSHDQTALMWAVAERHPGVVEMLVEYGADVHARSRVIPEFVMRTRKFVGEWVDRGGSTPLLFAARVGDIESARILLTHGASPNETAPDGYNALLLASHSGQGTFATFLLDHGADPNASAAGYTALHTAVLMGDLALVKALLAHEANPNVELTKGAPLRRNDSDPILYGELAGATPLFLAAKYLEIEMIRALVAAGANPLTPMKDKTTPLMAAAGIGWIGGADRRGANYFLVVPPDEDQAMEVVATLIQLGSDVKAANAAGDTALHGAAARGYNRIITLLLEKGASLEARNKKNQTPLGMTKPGTSAYEQISLDSTRDMLRKLGAKE